MNDYQHQINLERAAKLKEEGFEFEYNADGYKVCYKGKFVYAGSCTLPRSKPLH